MTELVYLKNDRAVCDSLQVAEKFHKRHTHIIQAIENLRANSSAENWAQSFKLSSYIDGSGKKNKKYIMNRDGFAILAMGFTGEKAIEWKWKYINAFNEMERLIMEQPTSDWQALHQQSKDVRRLETDTIQQFVTYAQDQGSTHAGHYYTNLTKLVNKAAGIRTRNLATGQQLNTVMFLERMIGEALRQGMNQGKDYRDIYDLCKSKVLTIRELALLEAA